MTWPKKTYLPLHSELCAAMGAHTCDPRQSCRLLTFETLITNLTIETLNSWQFLLPGNKEWQWTAFAILARFECSDPLTGKMPYPQPKNQRKNRLHSSHIYIYVLLIVRQTNEEMITNNCRVQRKIAGTARRPLAKGQARFTALAATEAR